MGAPATASRLPPKTAKPPGPGSPRPAGARPPRSASPAPAGRRSRRPDPRLKAVEKPETRKRLKAVEEPEARKRSVLDVGTLLAFCLFAGCLFLAVLHAVLVENQARLDDLISGNRQRQQRVDQLLAEIAYLDSPEGLAEKAASAGLVPAAEVVTLARMRPGALAPPPADPFGLAGFAPFEFPESAAAPPATGAAAAERDPRTLEGGG